MITGVHTLIAEVGNMDRSVEFYRDLLGLEAEMVSPYWSSLSCGGVRLGLHPPFSSHDELPSGGWILGVATNDIAELRLRLQQREVICGDYHDIPGGVVMDFRDPDGNRLQATQSGVKSSDLEG